MLFKFPQKKIVLDCFTTYEHILETAPIVPAMKLIPDWWKELPNGYRDNEGRILPTMRSCVGMVDYYKKSIVMPLWSDLLIKVRSATDYNWAFSDEFSEASYHPLEKQAAGFLANYAHIKLESPWRLKCKEDIQWIWSHPAYSFSDNHHTVSLPGIVSYKKQHGTNVNILIHAEKEKEIFIPQGQPLIHMTPMSDRKIEIVRHLVNEREYSRITQNSRSISFLRKYDVFNKRLEQFKDCPFHNHIKGK